MADTLVITFVPRDKQKSKYDWANLEVGSDRVGKVRSLIEGSTITIFSINVYPEYQGKNYGKIVIKELKKSFDTIIADNVRHKAVGFWVKMGFEDNKDGNYIYRRNTSKPE